MNDEGLAAWLGPQYGNDDAVTARMRAHQSRWRAAVLGEPCGVGPHESSTQRYGNFLSSEAAERGGNFLTSWVWDVVTERLTEGGGVERCRCLHNLLSSQPMCFNLFGQLRHRPDVATRLFSVLLPDEVGEVEEVAIEWAPTPKDQYLDDATSFDAFVRYRRAQSGDPAFLAVETKLTEPFSQTHYSAAATRGRLRGDVEVVVLVEEVHGPRHATGRKLIDAERPTGSRPSASLSSCRRSRPSSTYVSTRSHGDPADGFGPT